MTILFLVPSKIISGCLQRVPADGNYKTAQGLFDYTLMCSHMPTGGIRLRGRNVKSMVAKLNSSVCQFPLKSQKRPIMFNILSLNGGGKEQRCRVGRMEESSVANSIINVIPYHLLPVKAQAKFVLCCTHGSPVAKSRKTLSGQHDHRRVH